MKHVTEMYRVLTLAATAWLALGLVACRPQSASTPMAQTHTTSVSDAGAKGAKGEAKEVAKGAPPKTDDSSKATARETNQPDPTASLPKVTKRPKSFKRGVALGLFAYPKFSDAKKKALYKELLDEITETGATDLSLVVRWVQPDIRSTEIAPNPKHTADTAMLRWVMQQAKKRGLRVFLMPYIYLKKRKKGEWRGKIAPEDMDAWWASYTTFITTYADVAKEEDVELFAVGSELLSMERERERWVKLIDEVRTRFPGKLTYSSNWDHFEVVSFWDKVDVVGMTAYQELSKKDDPSVEELKAGWKPFMKRLNAWIGPRDIEFIFTEIGYPAHAEGAARPWDYTPKAQPDPQLQARCFRAMVEVFEDEKRLGGLYLWNWFGDGTLSDRGYSPRKKPAEKVLTHWFEKSK